MTNRTNYINIRERKSSLQQALFEEEEPEQVCEVGTILLKEGGTTPLKEIGTTAVKTDTTIPLKESPIVKPPAQKTDEKQWDFPENIPASELKTEVCEQCKVPISFLSDDLHPAIICKKCGHGQNNPNLKGRTWA